MSEKENPQPHPEPTGEGQTHSSKELDHQDLTDEAGKTSEQSEPETPSRPPSTPEDKEKAEQLIVQVNVAKVRGQKAIVTKLLEEAMELAYDHAPVLEAIGDDYVERRQFRKAKEAFLMAHKADPANKNIENKYGEMVLKVDLAIDPFTAMEANSGTFASAKAAVILNLFVPGVGHMVMEKTTKGIIILAGWLLCLLGVIFLPDGLNGLFGILGMNPPGTVRVPFNPLILLPIFGMLAFWLYGLADAKATASRFRPRKVEKPVPLSHHDYE